MSDSTILLLSGSLRKGSYNRMLLAEAKRVYGDATFLEGDLKLPLYDGDDEEANGVPGAVTTLADQIAQADAVILSSPEYNKGITGVLKNALDWLSRTKTNPLADKPVLVMSANMGRTGGESGQLMTRTCLVPHQARVIPGPLLTIAQAHEAFDDDGHLKNEMSQKMLSGLIDRLKKEIALG
ncbi:NADPH-dependent FMN reductase [Donghicola eburneus]|uniref:NADPH-dependent FMN reductase n=1 Tax=Donghicola eburneus TaxID=393278 RepID=A0A1M4MW88_9RHOB|nr:NADPH-dependent FMN reductase [Donghicola eburneus]SCM66801.1 NADPH-dependent FMN reductase [Donghicola eburneus]SFQ60328.1 chromate reductase [Donghicola eburneus]